MKSQSFSKGGVLLKVLLGAVVFAWMVSSGKLNLSQVARSLTQWPTMLAMVALGYAQVGITSYRWKLLLEAQEIRLAFRVAWGLMMIGMLFNVVIPGAVGGDLVKGVYITRAAPGRKAYAATSVLMDRLVGVIGLLFLGAMAVAFHLPQTMRNSATRSLGLMILFGFMGGMGALYIALIGGSRISTFRFLPAVMRNVFTALDEYDWKGPVIPVALVLSVVNQLITCAMYYLALRSVGVSGISAAQFFLVVPLGLVTTALPISPGGVGVGQAAFFALFQMVAPPYAAAGADAITVWQVLQILLSLSGLYWYISYKHIPLDAPAG
jgi:uncharacterized protein (TIRG00374 family)